MTRKTYRGLPEMFDTNPEVASTAGAADRLREVVGRTVTISSTFGAPAGMEAIRLPAASRASRSRWSADCQSGHPSKYSSSTFTGP